ncbi:hypothetical protein [Serratia microhaemolytica]|uniref:hypothetical protein n=1 Tax=Serratia microhaemolytica TaxID=2675110 RepID=UPI000FDEB5AF|nr:hypothetical protein [Serratia microhaemolytica]
MMNTLLKQIFLAITLASLTTSTFAYTEKQKLDYCATAGSWAAQTIANEEKIQNPRLDRDKVTSVLISRTKMKDINDKKIQVPNLGDLYLQTIMVSIPYINDEKKPAVFIASSIISAEECSISNPSYFILQK